MVLLLRAVDQSNLRLKELEHLEYLLRLQETELAESRQFREKPELLPGPSPETPEDDVRSLLGL